MIGYMSETTIIFMNNIIITKSTNEPLLINQIITDKNYYYGSSCNYLFSKFLQESYNYKHF